MGLKPGAYIIDDHNLFSGGMKELVQGLNGISDAACFADPAAAMDFAAPFEVKLIVTDYYVPGFNMADWIQTFQSQFNNVPIAVVSSSISRADRATCLDAGANAYFEKHQPPEQVMEGLQNLLHNRVVDPAPPTILTENTDLTARQIDILIQLARGMSVKEIARIFELSPETIKTHLAAIYRRLGVSGKLEAAEWARKNGLI